MAEEGRLTFNNTELTYKVKKLAADTTQLKLSIRSGPSRNKYALTAASSTIPAGALTRGILIVPEEAPEHIEYCLPAPKDLAVADKNTRAGYEFFIRNDSKNAITLTSNNAVITIDGPDQVEATSGSHWYLKYNSNTADEQGYEVIRLT